MKTKPMLMLLFLVMFSFRLIAAERLGMFVEVKRYFDEKKFTTFVIDYQVPYKNLMFEAKPKLFIADLKVSLSITKNDSVLYSKEFTDNIGVTNKYDVTTSNKSFLDRISLTLAKEGFKIKIRFEDVRSNKTYEWEYADELMNPEDKLSDVELISSISPDTTLYGQKFKRNRKSYLPEPSGLISKDIHDSLYLYCEAYNTNNPTATATLTIFKDDETILITTVALDMLENDIKTLLFPINLLSLDKGKYRGKIDITDGDTVFSRPFEFILTEQSEQLYFIFTDSEDEYQLLKYITNVKSLSSWKAMSKEAKKRYISQSWMNIASQKNQTVESVINLYKERVTYSNTRFSHFEKGWKTDRGRIYIRNGMPGDIVDDSTDDTKFVKKDYQIWKYSSNNHAAYIFVDIPMNGNFKLIYAKNDDQEATNPDWKKYMGSDFDETTLEKDTGKNLQDDRYQD